MQAPIRSRSFLARTGLATIAVMIAINVGAFVVLFGDTLAAPRIPYLESFTGVGRLDYRQFLGAWRIDAGRLVQTDDQLADVRAVLPLEVPAGEDHRFAARLSFLSGLQGGGLLFGLEDPDPLTRAHLVRFGRGDDGLAYLVYGGFDATGTFSPQGRSTSTRSPRT